VESRAQRWRSVSEVLGERRVGGGGWCGGVVVRAALYRLREEGRQSARRGMVNVGAV
jgi:hypothetical protein